jgi:HK97 gp10 family phage protein
MVNASVHLRINKAEFLKLLDDANAITEEAADKMAKEMKKSILSGAKSGRQYYINGARHTASSPGQAPANVSGELVRSIKVSKDKNKATVSISKNYAVFLEFGTSKMRPRPFVLPAFQKTKKWFSDRLHRLAYKGTR